jgi:hypothetical protein
MNAGGQCTRGYRRVLNFDSRLKPRHILAAQACAGTHSSLPQTDNMVTARAIFRTSFCLFFGVFSVRFGFCFCTQSVHTLDKLLLDLKAFALVMASLSWPKLCASFPHVHPLLREFAHPHIWLRYRLYFYVYT